MRGNPADILRDASWSDAAKERLAFVVTVGILWVVLSPYGTGLLVAWFPLANRVVTRRIGV